MWMLYISEKFSLIIRPSCLFSLIIRVITQLVIVLFKQNKKWKILYKSNKAFQTLLGGLLGFYLPQESSFCFHWWSMVFMSISISLGLCSNFNYDHILIILSVASTERLFVILSALVAQVEPAFPEWFPPGNLLTRDVIDKSKNLGTKMIQIKKNNFKAYGHYKFKWFHFGIQDCDVSFQSSVCWDVESPVTQDSGRASGRPCWLG